MRFVTMGEKKVLVSVIEICKEKWGTTGHILEITKFPF